MVEARQEPAVSSKLLGPSEEASPSRSRMNPVSYFLYSDASGLADPAGTEPPHSQAGQFVEMVQEAPRMSSFGKPDNPEPTPQACLSLVGGGVSYLQVTLHLPQSPQGQEPDHQGQPLSPKPSNDSN